MFQDPNLPCGVTNAMCEPNDPSCGNCGHLFSDHYYEDGQEEIYERSPLKEEILRNQCGCTEFSDHYYEPEWEKDD